jgi:hypothetical protein
MPPPLDRAIHGPGVRAIGCCISVVYIDEFRIKAFHVEIELKG